MLIGIDRYILSTKKNKFYSKRDILVDRENGCFLAHRNQLSSNPLGGAPQTPTPEKAERICKIGAYEKVFTKTPNYCVVAWEAEISRRLNFIQVIHCSL